MRFALTTLVMLAACAAPAATQQPASTVIPKATVTAAETATPTWWQPVVGASWQIQFTGDAIDTGLDVDIYNLDLFDTPVELVQQLHSDGKRVMCYFNVGAWEDWRPDAADFSAEVLGNEYEGWPGERWLDVSNVDALEPIMLARLDLCAAKGFDGVDPDNLDGFNIDTGFELTSDHAIVYITWLAEEAHACRLAFGIKNVPELAVQLEPYADWVLTESCFDQGWCEDLLPFLSNGKPVFAIEYVENGTTLEDFCALAEEMQVSAILKTRELDAEVQYCP